MAFILNDRVKQSISSTGTDALVLGGTSSGYISFADGVGDGNSTYYAIENLPKWEVGIGTYNNGCLLYTSPSPRDRSRSRMPSSA